MRGVKVLYEDTHKTFNGIELKKCSDCKEWLPLNNEHYYKNKSSKIDGYNPYCKECTKKRSSKWQQENPDRYKDLKAEWYQQNREDRLERQQLHDLNRKEVKSEYSQQYRKSEHGKKKYHQYGLKRKVKNHKISRDEWSSCKEYFNHECAYCGLKLKDHKKKYAEVLKQIDFNKEHVDDEGANDLSNCVPSCHSCNSKKRTKDFDDWYNESNINYTKERYDKIIQWLENDYRLYIESN